MCCGRVRCDFRYTLYYKFWCFVQQCPPVGVCRCVCWLVWALFPDQATTLFIKESLCTSAVFNCCVIYFFVKSWCWFVWSCRSDCVYATLQLADTCWVSGFRCFTSTRMSVFVTRWHYSPWSPVHLRPCTFTWKPLCVSRFVAHLSLSFPALITLFFHTGQWSSPGGISHQEEIGLSAEGVSNRRQGRYRQFQHPSTAPGYAPGASEEPAAGNHPKAKCKVAYEAVLYSPTNEEEKEWGG